MGKRKSASKPMAKKKKEPLSTSFKCVFCNNEKSVSVKIEKKVKLASLSCRDCGQTFQTGDVTNLTHPVDVYCEWIDACEEVAKKAAAPPTARDAPLSSTQLGSGGGAASRQQASLRAGLAPGEKYTDEDAGFIDDEDADLEGDFGED